MALVVGYWRRSWLQRLIAAPIRWFSPRLGEQVMQLTGRFLEGLQVFVSLRQTAQVLLLSAAWWGSAVVTYYFVGQALGLGLMPWHYLLVMVVSIFGALIPAAPSSVGTFHGFARLGLFLVALDSVDLALAFAALGHALDWLVVCGMGSYFVLRDRLFVRLLQRAPDATPPAARQERFCLAACGVADSAGGTD